MSGYSWKTDLVGGCTAFAFLVLEGPESSLSLFCVPPDQRWKSYSKDSGLCVDPPGYSASASKNVSYFPSCHDQLNSSDYWRAEGILGGLFCRICCVLCQKSCAEVFLQTGESENLRTYFWTSKHPVELSWCCPWCVQWGRGRGASRCRMKNCTKYTGRQASRGDSWWHWGQVRRAALPASCYPGLPPSHHPLCSLTAPLWILNWGPNGDVCEAILLSSWQIGFLSWWQREFSFLSVTWDSWRCQTETELLNPPSHHHFIWEPALWAKSSEMGLI